VVNFFASLLIAAYLVLQQGNHLEKAPKPKEVDYFEKTVKDILSLSAKVPKRIKAGERLPFSVQVKNQSKEIVSFSEEFWKHGELIIKIRGKQGEAIPHTRHGAVLWNRQLSRNITVTLKPTQDVELRYNLSRLFDLSVAGNHILEIGFVCRVEKKVHRINLDLPFRIEEGE
jgi:hypothetical protein